MLTDLPTAKTGSALHHLQTLFCITHDLPPLKTPIAIRANKILREFQKDWRVNVLTGTPNASLNQQANVNFVKSWYPRPVIELLFKLRLEKLSQLLIWPDSEIFWFVPGLLKGYQLIKKQKADAIFVLMMPYSAGLIGIMLKWLTGLPLVLSLDDSLSCTDMHPSSATWLHHHLEKG
jgi:hypothetical protein